MHFYHSDYSNSSNINKSKFGELTKSHTTTNPIIKLNRNTKHCLIAIRNTRSELRFNYSTSGVMYIIDDKPIGDTTYHYETIPSNYSIEISWSIYYDSLTKYLFKSGYNDTSYLTIIYILITEFFLHTIHQNCITITNINKRSKNFDV